MGKASDVVSTFFDAFNDHDVNRMTDCCSETGTIHYVPVEMWGRQRVFRGDGNLSTLGKIFWTGLIDSFPDVSNSVEHIAEDPTGRVAAEVVLTGTQAKPWGNISHQGRQFSLDHLFLIDVNEAGLISRISAYWDGAALCRQLGQNEVD